MTRSLKQLMATAWIVAGVGLATVLAAMVMVLRPMYGPSLEVAIAPVLEQAPSPAWRGEDGSVHVNVWVDKLRPECVFLRGSASYQVGDDDGGWHGLLHSRPNHALGASRGGGLQNFGTWRFIRGDGAPMEAGKYIKGVWRYECHDDWDTPAEVGPWRVP